MQKIAIVGGGTAGWMTAAALCHIFEEASLEIILIESEQIGTVGVGEAALPHLRYFNERLGINEHEFMRETKATYKLGIEFSEWGRLNDSYIHPFGEFGFKTDGIPFYHYWLKAKLAGYDVPIDDFSLPVLMARESKFAYPSSVEHSIYSTYSYSFHLDSSRYALFLRKYCEEKSRSNGFFKRVEGKIVDVLQNADSGNVESLRLDGGDLIEADFFIDCSGFRALLLDKTYSIPYEDWSQWMPCDRAVAVPTASVGPPVPYTKAMARHTGWQWQIPLQHRTGNGIVYSSEFLGDDEAASRLNGNLEGEALADLNFIRFKPGRRKQSWYKNCVAIGLSSGFLEPLESTSIYLIQVAIMKLADLLPDGQNLDVQSQEFNRQMTLEYERIRDFLILHYHATERDDSEFWAYCKNMSIPASLKLKMDAFKASGYIATYDQGLFFDASWAAVYMGQRVEPRSYHQAVNHMSDSDLKKHLDLFRKEIVSAASRMPDHISSLERHCASDSKDVWPAASLSLYGMFS